MRDHRVASLSLRPYARRGYGRWPEVTQPTRSAKAPAVSAVMIAQWPHRSIGRCTSHAERPGFGDGRGKHRFMRERIAGSRVVCRVITGISSRPSGASLRS